MPSLKPTSPETSGDDVPARAGSDAVLGFRVHTGWAAVVAVCGSAARPTVVDRRRLVLTEKTDHDSVFVYHAAAELDVAKADRYVETGRRVAQATAHAALGTLLGELRAAGHEVVRAGVPTGPSRPLPALAAILRAHTLLHAAECVLFHEALVEACEAHRLSVTRVDAKTLAASAARAGGLRAEALQRRLADLGKALGPPWTVDEKQATLAALLALGPIARP
jgi:hypothetical protein